MTNNMRGIMPYYIAIININKNDAVYFCQTQLVQLLVLQLHAISVMDTMEFKLMDKVGMKICTVLTINIII